ncbi:MAG TPA: DUF2950 domain-containing protein [Candidatus Sulfotelmatobacter sp.]|nr:DUF2950 domain-containing protein [Candidatus Sulfotelmatobacter sp.]
MTDRGPALGVAVVPPVWGLAGAEEAAVVVAGGADSDFTISTNFEEPTQMNLFLTNSSGHTIRWAIVVLFCALCVPMISAAQQTVSHTASQTVPGGVRAFDTPQQCAAALIEAADKFDVSALTEIFGPHVEDVIFSGEFAQDRKHAADFVVEAREKNSISLEPKTGIRAFLLVGNEDWPFPVPIVKAGNKWFFDTQAGRQELVYRRIGANELDAIEICYGYVEAQHEYALQPREGYDVNQYAQRIVSTPGKQDGLAWQNSDGTWDGPIGEKIARAIEQGYTSGADPYHGYFFKILKGQGPAAPLGQMNFVVNGVMIGGFALVAAPAEYGVTGVKTFIVSHDGVVYEKDLGAKTLDEFQTMEVFNPDRSWAPVPEQD